MAADEHSLADHIAGCIGVRESGGLALGKGAMACVELVELRVGASAADIKARQTIRVTK